MSSPNKRSITEEEIKSQAREKLKRENFKVLRPIATDIQSLLVYIDQEVLKINNLEESIYNVKITLESLKLKKKQHESVLKDVINNREELQKKYKGVRDEQRSSRPALLRVNEMMAELDQIRTENGAKSRAPRGDVGGYKKIKKKIITKKNYYKKKITR